MNETISAADAAQITAYLDVEARPTMPTAHIIFGTNQATPADLVACRYHQGLAPFIVLTGGVNRHTGVLEAIEHRRALLEHGVPEAAMAAVCKWYHRRAIQLLRAFLPDEPFFHAATWEPVYDGVTVARTDWWFKSAVAAQRVLKEWRVIPRATGRWIARGS